MTTNKTHSERSRVGAVERRAVQIASAGTALLLGAALLLAFAFPGEFWATLDQQGQRLLDARQPAEAAAVFRDPARRGEALFDAGQFEDAAAAFAALPGEKAAFNHGNALVMRGKYEEAAKRYDRALQLRPGWAEAEQNRAIAVGRAEQLKRSGGEGTGGKLGADDIVFDNAAKQGGDTEEVQAETEAAESSEMLQSVWLRQVQTTPSQFLRMKFAYQQAERSRDTAGESDEGER